MSYWLRKIQTQKREFFSNIDTSDKSCKPFSSGQRILTERGVATVLGVLRNKGLFTLVFESDGFIGYWSPRHRMFVNNTHSTLVRATMYTGFTQFDRVLDISDKVCSSFGFLPGQQIKQNDKIFTVESTATLLGHQRVKLELGNTSCNVAALYQTWSVATLWETKSNPSSMVLDSHNNLYYISNKQLFKLKAGCAPQKVIAVPTLESSTVLMACSHNKIYICEQLASPRDVPILEFDLSCGSWTILDGRTIKNFCNKMPQGLAVSNSDTLYIANRNIIYKLDNSKTMKIHWAADEDTTEISAIALVNNLNQKSGLEPPPKKQKQDQDCFLYIAATITSNDDLSNETMDGLTWSLDPAQTMLTECAPSAIFQISNGCTHKVYQDERKVIPSFSALKDGSLLIQTNQELIRKHNSLDVISNFKWGVKKDVGCRLVTSNGKSVFIKTKDAFLQLDSLWSILRLILVGHKKESAAYCNLAKLGKHNIRYIMWLVATGGKRIFSCVDQTLN